MRAKQFGILFLNTLQREYRSKALIIIFVLTLVIIFLVNGIFNIFTNSEGQNIIVNLENSKLSWFYTVISIWSGIMATLFGVYAIQSDYDFNLINQLWAFPIKKTDYLIARITGSWFIVCAYYVISLGMGIILFSVTSSKFLLATIASFSVSSLYILVLIILATLYSVFLPKIVAFITVLLTSMLITFSNNTFMHTVPGELFKNLTIPKFLGVIIHLIFPRTGLINEISSNLVSEKSVLAFKGTPINLYMELPHFVLTLLLLCYILNRAMIKRGI